MNLTDIAREAGVSVATVSKAFSGARDISDATRERVFAVARLAGCFDHYNKNKFPKHVIAVLLPELTSEYYSAIAAVLEREITAAGGIMTVSTANFDKTRAKELFDYYASYAHADGIILIDAGQNLSNTTGVPAVAFSGKQRKRQYIDTIVLNFDSGLTAAVQHLKELGHTEIGFACETLAVAKQEHFCTAMRRAGLTPHKRHLKLTDARFEQAGEVLAAEWLREGELPTAIITAYDHIAIGAMRYFRRHGVRVPEDISLIGMDDIPLCTYLDSALTSIRVPAEAACREAVALVLKKMKNQHYSVRDSIVLQTELVLRDTTGAPRKP